MNVLHCLVHKTSPHECAIYDFFPSALYRFEMFASNSFQMCSFSKTRNLERHSFSHFVLSGCKISNSDSLTLHEIFFLKWFFICVLTDNWIFLTPPFRKVRKKAENDFATDFFVRVKNIPGIFYTFLDTLPRKNIATV